MQVFRAGSVSGIPINGLAITQIADALVSMSPAYLTLQLNGLSIDVSGPLGSRYALVLSFSTPVKWHSLSGYDIAHGRPESGIANVDSSWVRYAECYYYRAV
jgi:hypothetical protein